MTRHSRFGFLAIIPALLLALPLLSFAHPRQMEAINRGLVVSNVGKAGVLVSWRLLGTEKADTEFNLYRDGKKIATIGKTDLLMPRSIPEPQSIRPQRKSGTTTTSIRARPNSISFGASGR